MKQFNIVKNSTLPYLEIEPVVNGRFTFRKLYDAIQNADVKFSMKNIQTGVWKVANETAYVVNCNDSGCEDRFKLQYRWRERDTKESGVFLAQFKITFYDDIVVEDVTFPKGDLIVPIADKIMVNVIDEMTSTP